MVDPVTLPLVALIVDVPAFSAVASPAALIVATVVVPEAQTAPLVKSCVVLSLNVPVAVNCCVFPTRMEGFAGVTAIDTNTAAVTVSVVVPLIDPDAALIVTGPPIFTPVASPVALIVATVTSDELHVTEFVRSCFELSLNVPVAVNCCLFPAATEGFAGVTAIDSNVAFVTVSVVDPTTLPLVALIVELPAFTAVARPPEVIVATVVVPEAHTTLPVKSCVVVSLNVPVAVNCCVPPTMTEGLAGVTAIDTNTAAVTFNVVDPTMLPLVALIVEVPTFSVVARPPALIVATVVVPEAHTTLPVRFCVVLSLNVPVAVNCCVFPAATDGLAGVTAIDTSTAAVMVSEVVPLIVPDTALIVTGPPVFTPVASPAELIVANVVSDELHVTEFVKFCVEVSLNVPVAVNCCVFPAGIDGFVGVTAIETNAAAVTVNVVDPTTLPLVALIVDVPAFSAVASPAALIVATVVVPDAQTALLVKSCVVVSLKVPVAVNCCVFPAATDGFAGVTAIDTNTAAVTVSVVVPLIDPDAALIVTGPPIFTPVASPVALIVATVTSDELHVTEFVRSCFELSLNVPVAVNCCLFPAATEGFAGVTAIDSNVAFVTVSVVDPTTLPLVALIVELPAFTAVARPPEVIVATVVVPEAHTTLPVKSCVVVSLNVPVAVNCCVPPTMTEGLAGVTAIDTNTAAVTFNVVDPTMLPLVALIVEVPTFSVVARPPALIVATVVVPEAHTTLPVRFCVVLSLNVPVAVNCCVFPAATDGLAGVTAIDTSTAAVTVNVVDPTTLPLVALIVDVPTFSVVASPPAAIVATVVVPDAHVTLPVRFCVVLSLNVPVAVNCCLFPAATDGFTGVTAIDTSAAAVTVNVVDPTTLPLVALIVDVPTFSVGGQATGVDRRY